MCLSCDAHKLLHHCRTCCTHVNLRCCILLHTFVVHVAHDTPHELRICHIMLHVGHHLGTCYHCVTLSCCISLYMLVIMLGHVTTKSTYVAAYYFAWWSSFWDMLPHMH